MHRNRLLMFTLIATTILFTGSVRAAVKEQVLHSFGEDDNGAYPISSLVADSRGNLFGTTNLAGANGAGTIFELSPAAGGGWNFVLLHSFSFDQGSDSRSGLLIDRSGNLYGTTNQGGSSASGTAFELSPSGSGFNFNVLYNFMGGTDGGFPSGPLISDGKSSLFGLTGGGGGSSNCTFGCGTVFQLTKTGAGQWVETVLYSFQGGSDGSGPFGPLTADRAGNLYGITGLGGSSQCQGGCGTVFRLHRTMNGTWRKQIVFRFTDKEHGWFPNGGLIFDQAGNLYGTTSLGGDLTCNPPNGCGIVFKINSKGEETMVHGFSGSNGDGMLPETGLSPGPNGHLLGTTSEGGHSVPNCEFGCGTVFDVTPAGKVIVIYSFANADGMMPLAPVYWDGAGHVYGTTFEGGDGAAGTVFELTR